MSSFKKGDLILFSHEEIHYVSLVTAVKGEGESMDVILFLRNDHAYEQCLLNALEKEGIDVYDFLRETHLLKTLIPTKLKQFLQKGHIIAFANSIHAKRFIHLDPQHVYQFSQLHPYKDLLLHILNKNPGRVIAPKLHL